MIGAGSMHPETLLEHIRKAKEATRNPFGVNVPLFYPELETIMEMIAGFTDRFLALEQFSQASFVSRLKHEQSEIRKAVSRIHAIREIHFSEASYAIAEIITFMLTIGMIFLKFDPFYEGLFLTIFVSFILIYMLLLIRDLDDPFAYYDKKHSVEEVSLHSLENLKIRLDERRKELGL